MQKKYIRKLSNVVLARFCLSWRTAVGESITFTLYLLPYILYIKSHRFELVSISNMRCLRTCLKVQFMGVQGLQGVTLLKWENVECHVHSYMIFQHIIPDS